jgi:transposase InsO family protein
MLPTPQPIKSLRTLRALAAPALRLRVQYASKRFRAQLASHRTTASMSRRGNCCDNARAEALFSTLKIKLF